MHELETYLNDVMLVRTSGVGQPEQAYYNALANLLNAVGKQLTPRVHCVMLLRNQGAGFPDGGLLTPDQFRRTTASDLFQGTPPSRGVIEAKPISQDAWVTADTRQVSTYWDRYRTVLVTNFRDFVLVGPDRDGNPVKLESYRLAPSEAEFWAAAATPRRTAAAHGVRFVEFLRRVMLHGAALTDPKDVAAFLASYARDAKARIEAADWNAQAALGHIRQALEQALGITFTGDDGIKFFRSTLVQTLFYGVFSAWVLWSRRQPRGSTQQFDWRTAHWTLHVPLIRALFEQVATPSRLGPLGLVEVLDWTAAVLNRVDRAAFFAKFDEQFAVQYFYEPFLKEFDPELRKQLGVWYTPPEVVQYMVARVDTVLRTELGIAAGLADERVVVLDPCTGTGSYLVEVLRRIRTTLEERGDGALTAAQVKRAATTRVFGFEMLPAPFVVAHLQLGLYLQTLGAPLDPDNPEERAGVYLTNALTGWDTSERGKQIAYIPELQEEHDAAEEIKQKQKILVVIGNPPYNSFAGLAIGEERILTNAYRVAKTTKQPQGQGLNDLYVRFFRMAERRIVEQTKQGVVCFISNYSWLDGLSFTAMRERYLEVFDRIWIDCLNGDKYKTGKLTPDGQPDPSIFSTDWNRDGIQVGTAIALMVRREQHTSIEAVEFRHLWGKDKRETLASDAQRFGEAAYESVAPSSDLGLPYFPMRSGGGYVSWPTLLEIFPKTYAGVKTSRDELVVDIDRQRLVTRMQQYFDNTLNDDMIAAIAPSAMSKGDGFNPKEARARLVKRGFLSDKVVRYCYRPFDLRWIYWEPETRLLDRKREEYFPQVFEENIWIEARQKQPMEDWDRGYVTRTLADNFGNGLSNFFPLYTRPTEGANLFSVHLPSQPQPNISDSGIAFINGIHVNETALFYCCVAALHSPAYRYENAGALRQDWPRIPLPAQRDALLASAALGKQVAALLDTGTPVPGVTSGGIRAELRAIGVPTRAGGGQLNPAADFAVTAGWGHAGKDGVTMPGRGKAMERDYTADERRAIEEGAAALGLSPEQAFAHLGQTTFDVYLNNGAFWANVPARVWAYTIGGYQVMKKWLSYRERPLLGRDLRLEEVLEVRDMARRIAALALLEPALNESYQRVKADTWPWPR